MKPGVAARAAAARAISAVATGDSLDRVLAQHGDSLPERDQALYRELCFGTLRFLPMLDAILGRMLRQPLRKRDREVKALALVGLYQLHGMRVPAHAAVSTTVDAASALRRHSSAGLLNAVLRRFQRESADLLDSLEPAQRAATPDWLWNALGSAWPQQREQIAAASNQHPPMTLRVNLSRRGRDDFLAALEDAGIEGRGGRLSPAAITLAEAVNVGDLPGFDTGDCSVQDEAAQLAALLLAPAPGENILDACAAPGGKSGHILEACDGAARLVATDISAERLQRVADNLARLRRQATLLCTDAAKADAELTAAGPFNAILLDAPCSATGVIRRHPDIKVLRRPGDAAGFAEQQLALLRGLWPLLAPGGRLLYVTCSVLPQENSEVIARYLAENPRAREAGLSVPGAQACAHGQQLLPQPDGPDGLYFAQLHKPL